jgi:SPX domain protein involved in polyphosphate accumulation/uncharacterized membrane protein YidH (DUF202 family)
MEIRTILQKVETEALQLSHDKKLGKKGDELREEVEKAGAQFLKLEKYVNLNFTGFHKILKKHDRRLPNPCRSFYISRLHDQSWVRGDYSDVIVAMSRVYSTIRGDEEVQEKENEKQDFVRSTRKYWVHTEDISKVKYIVLQHLPVFLQKTMGGETDSQLVNSVYLDNDSMELYHGRLDKTPGAIALRMRWYGTGTPETVFVERKTHRESWAGELSVKERFIIPEKQVQPLIDGKYDVDEEMKKMRAKGKSEEQIKEWYGLASEVTQAISSKQLYPTMRTQYMRTAFQIPFDATVRVSLDTNLCMIQERTDEILEGQRWYRDPTQAVPLNEITRFPHAVLEIKLQLEDESQTPAWVTELLNSGMLLEVHKFSKFIHGCSVLMPEDVIAVPYWVDDATLQQSISQSGAQRILEKSEGANQLYSQLLPHDKSGAKRHVVSALDKPNGTKQIRAINLDRDPEDVEDGGEPDDRCAEFFSQYCEWASGWEAAHMTGQKVEPKVFFANERTFITWMQMSVTISSISVGVLAFTKKDSRAQYFALSLLPLALLFVIYAVRQFTWRAEKIRTRDVSRWDDALGPVFLTSVLIVALTVQFFLTAQEHLRTSSR